MSVDLSNLDSAKGKLAMEDNQEDLFLGEEDPWYGQEMADTNLKVATYTNPADDTGALLFGLRLFFHLGLQKWLTHLRLRYATFSVSGTIPYFLTHIFL